MKTVKLETPEKVEMFKNYDDVMRRILAEASREKEALDHQILLKKTEYKNTGELISSQKQNFEQWKRSETAKVNDELTKKRNDFMQRENALRIGEEQYKKKISEISERERLSVGLVEERQKLTALRIEVEKLHTKAKEEMALAQRKFDEADAKISNFSLKEAKILETEKKVNAINLTLARREEEDIVRKKDIEARLKNLEEVKKAVEPKILELRVIEENIKKEKRELADEKNIVLKKIEEEASLLKGLEAREQKVREKEKEQLQRDEEITRKALLAGIK